MIMIKKLSLEQREKLKNLKFINLKLNLRNKVTEDLKKKLI